MSQKSTDISKFLSYILRHQPEAIGLSLDTEGWAVISDLILCAVKEGYILENSLIHSIVDNSDKRRFTISDDGLRIRAVQGHSTQQVNISYKEKTPPEILYHGTATRFISAIREQGLIPVSRQYVHLSPDEETAIQVGQRHGKPIVLTIKALNMYEQGFKFYQADNGVWLTDTVPYQFIQE
ncbi:RNA 2'-phosphotransferase [Dickeya parazeae]|uniref:Probable RNA 2'-phosphotransferase n=1 Tax=Dickeya zeae (strain Ech586) TaxID=590409 RepID=D2BYX7_DICZ5|nr:RNA 2'-phosphotransferase [Dickeya parazeae]ACZ78784.1 phosphotransferase KptA/Tpt1 [Dickeya parazeae Ech586]MBP2837046.1 RNA 2'-phosphotransferase [Dickeya parazeae]